MKEAFELIRKKDVLEIIHSHSCNTARIEEGVLNLPIVEAEYGNDVCEWKDEKGMFIQNPHTGRKFSNEPSMKNIYCNTCGKKIKVVE